MEKKKIIIVGLVPIIIIISSIVGGIVFYMNVLNKDEFIVSGGYLPFVLDPLEAREPFSFWIIGQVVESLFDINPNDNKLLPNLATSYSWSENNLELTCNLRQGVKFHDGADFNAEVVKWNFARLYGMIEHMPHAYLWQFTDSRRIIKETRIIDDYIIKIVLNEPYAPFLGLLTRAYILSPMSTVPDGFINTYTGDLVGTGPFIYDSYETDIEVRMSANSNYWGGQPAINNLIFRFFENIEASINALFSGELDLFPKVSGYWNPDMPILGDFSDFTEKVQADSSLLLVEGPPDTTISYLGMNNKRIPVEMRKAMAYAIDYDYIIEELHNNWSHRMRSPIPEGILYSNNEDFNVPVLDLEIARKSLKNANWLGTTGLPLDNDEPWEALVDNNTPLAIYNYSYVVEEDGFGESILTLLQNNFKKIGIGIEDAGMDWIELLQRGYHLDGYHLDMLELFDLGWNADYNDPNNYIVPLMSSQSDDNWAQIDDASLQNWMDQAERENEPSIREDLYYKIQKHFIEELYPWCMLEFPKIVAIQSANLRGYFPTSFLWKIQLKTVYFV